MLKALFWRLQKTYFVVFNLFSVKTILLKFEFEIFAFENFGQTKIEIFAFQNFEQILLGMFGKAKRWAQKFEIFTANEKIKICYKKK